MTARDTDLWAVHIIGSDDVLAARTYEAALMEAHNLNTWVVSRRDRHPYDPHIWAVPRRWADVVSDASPEAHARALEARRQRREIK
jgi:hypothetical protein